MASGFGPFSPLELSRFRESLEQPHETFPLIVPPAKDEERGPLKFVLLSDEQETSRRDSVKIDSAQTLKALMWECHDVRRDNRVFTVVEILRLWDDLFRICRALESLIFHAEAAVNDASPENLVALRKAVWRNRDSDDVDPHYRDRFW